MANLYITEQNSVLRKTGDRLIVKKDDAVLLDVPCHKIDAVLIFGNVQFTTQAVHELLEHGIELAILTRNGRLVGQLTSPATKNVYLRVAQFKKLEDAAFRLDVSRRIVSAKIRNGRHLIRRHAANHPDNGLLDDLAAVDRILAEVQHAESASLLGLEGSAARHYFRAFGKMLRDGIAFDGRKKRPPPDPVNAVLSFSYTMLFNEIASLLDGLGFDPYVGFYHTIDYGRASLAADLVEEFRAPLADRLTLNLFNLEILTPDSFKTNPRSKAFNLKRDALQRYFKEYEKFVSSEFDHPQTGERTTLRKCIRTQARRMADTVQNDAPYIPFEMEG